MELVGSEDLFAVVYCTRAVGGGALERNVEVLKALAT